MKIRAGFRLGYECQHDTAMLLVLNIHPSRRADLLTDQVLSFDRPIEAWSYLDSFGNACSRIVAPPGLTTISTEFEIYDDGMPDPVPQNAFQHDIKDLPDDVLVFLLGSRYCDTDRLADFAWKTFSATPLGWPRVQAILDFAHNHITFNYQNADPLRTAFGGFTDRTGVCRDFAHLAITLCRCMNIPARYCTGYLQVYLGGRWNTVDARHNKPRIGRILMATGRDATDVALSTAFGPAILASFQVTTEEIPASA
jgi:transglutaminase-like putative cysteine protease